MVRVMSAALMLPNTPHTSTRSAGTSSAYQRDSDASPSTTADLVGHPGSRGPVPGEGHQDRIELDQERRDLRAPRMGRHARRSRHGPGPRTGSRSGSGPRIGRRSAASAHHRLHDGAAAPTAATPGPRRAHASAPSAKSDAERRPPRSAIGVSGWSPGAMTAHRRVAVATVAWAAGDQVPRLEAPPRPGPHPDLPGLRRPHGARSLHRHHPRGPGLQGPGRRTSPPSTAPATPTPSPAPTSRPMPPPPILAALQAAVSPPQRPPRQTGLRPRDVQPSGPVLPTAQRRSDRCRAGRHRLGVCGVTSVPPPVDDPHRGGGPGRLDHRRADGVREAVGAPFGQAAGAAGAGAARRAGPRHPGRRACALAPTLGHFDLAYLDPPYNQHRYFTNYHVWETLVAWDAPEAYGVARKRVDARDPSTHSAFNSKRTMPAALASVVPIGGLRPAGAVLQQRVLARRWRSSRRCAPSRARQRRHAAGRREPPRPASGRGDARLRLGSIRRAPASASSTRPGARWAG